MKETAPLAILRDCVVGLIIDRVRLVHADGKTGVLSQKVKQDVRQTMIPVIQQSCVPRTLISVEARDETVHRDEYRAPMLCFASVQFGANAIVIGTKYLALPRDCLCRRYRLVTRYGGVFAQANNRFRRSGRSIAVNDEPGICLQNQKCVESRGQLAGYGSGSNIPSNMSAQIISRQAQRVQPAWQYCPSVIAGQEKL